MSHARAHEPDIIVLENTDSIADDPSTGEALQSEHDAAKSNVKQCILDFEEAGYEAQPFLLVSTDYGVPQKRRRFFVVALRVNSALWTIDDRQGYDAVFNRFLQRMEEVKMAPPQLSRVLLKDDHPYVTGELKRRQALPRQPSGVGASWQADARASCEKYNLRWGAVPVPERFQNHAWYQTLSERDRSILLLLSTVHGEGCMVDTSQSLGCCRLVKAPARASATMLPNSQWFCDLPDVTRPILGYEALTALQAFPGRIFPRGTSDNFLADLAGNAFTGTVIGAIWDCIAQVLPWSRPVCPVGVAASFVTKALIKKP